MFFADWLKKYRNIAGLTQKELAQKLNIPQSTINKYENEGVEPRVSFAVSVAQILDASLDELSGVVKDKEQQQLDYINSLIKPYYKITREFEHDTDANGEYIESCYSVFYCEALENREVKSLNIKKDTKECLPDFSFLNIVSVKDKAIQVAILAELDNYMSDAIRLKARWEKFSKEQLEKSAKLFIENQAKERTRTEHK